MMTLQEFESLVPEKSVQLAYRRTFISKKGSYDEFVRQLYQDIDGLIYNMQASRELLQDDCEDRLSHDILGGLKIHGYTAIPDGKTGGHVDLSVKLGDFTWIGEAKKDGNFHEGFLQLTSRYVPASGNYSHNQGGLLFYLVKTPDARTKLNDWRDALAAAGNACVDCAHNQLAFFSTHKLAGSGTDFKVRTMAITLFHQPKDKSARLSAAKRAAKNGQ